jgi:hypothetical protein
MQHFSHSNPMVWPPLHAAPVASHVSNADMTETEIEVAKVAQEPSLESLRHPQQQ